MGLRLPCPRTAAPLLRVWTETIPPAFPSKGQAGGSDQQQELTDGGVGEEGATSQGLRSL